MAYTGTGTEADPYCVSTLSDFFYCINQGGAFVKVISDIDGETDETYTGEITDTKQIYCSKIYADEKKSIKGISFLCDIAFEINSSIIIDNIDFMHCVFCASR